MGFELLSTTLAALLRVFLFEFGIVFDIRNFFDECARGLDLIEILVVAVLEVPKVLHVHHLKLNDLAAEPIVLQDYLRPHLVNRIAPGPTEVLDKLGSKDFVNLDFGSCSYDGERVRQVIESALLAEHCAAFKVAHYEVLLLLFVVEGALSEDEGQFVNGVYYFANAAVNKVEVVALLFNLLQLVALSDNFFREVGLKVFDEAAG